MEAQKLRQIITTVLENMPSDWLKLTTHRLDIYNESLAKIEFLEHFDALVKKDNLSNSLLNELPTAYDYIRLGHPLSCVLEWVIAELNDVHVNNVIAFDSKTTPVLAILRQNTLAGKSTKVCFTGQTPTYFKAHVIKEVYGYKFETIEGAQGANIPETDDTIVLISEKNDLQHFDSIPNVDFYINVNPKYGSVLLAKGYENEKLIPEIQHLRRRETIAMTPINCLALLEEMISKPSSAPDLNDKVNKEKVETLIKGITGTTGRPLMASSGLSMQYAIMMGLIDEALQNHPGKDIKFVVPPNCYGGTNDQARRVAATLSNVAVVDLPVDGGKDMVSSVDTVLNRIAEQDAVAYIIAEIPTNPRVEVPDLDALQAALSKERHTPDGQVAVAPVFILDQTFCPNVQFLGEGGVLPNVQSISYVSGSKFPSAGKCTAGYCVTDEKANYLMPFIEKHLILCENRATSLQLAYLAEQLPSMNQRIKDAYVNTRKFVDFIEEVLPEAKINFVSQELADRGFTPSVFSLDLPTKGATEEERESHKRALNLKLINSMITEIPTESKFCVSYGQPKGCYWTIPATSTQGTTKEGDKDYIVRVSVSPNLDFEKHKQVFLDFVQELG